MIVAIRRFWVNCAFPFVLALFGSSHAAAEDADMARLFAELGVNGTVVVESLDGGQRFVHNDARAARRFAVASTFKIFNTLIALEEHAIAGKDAVLKWDGQVREFPDWNRDQTLESAFRVSCVWCFQDLARKVGGEKYRMYLRQAGYGELREPFDETTFWLDGSLQISALEQVAFLKKVYRQTLPFSAASYETLRQIMLVERTPRFTLRAKTGWAARMTPQTGWYVGYVETAADVWFFATNLDVGAEADLPLRQQLTRGVLMQKGIIPSL